MTKIQVVTKNTAAFVLLLFAMASLNSVRNMMPLSLAVFIALLYTPINAYVAAGAFVLSCGIYSSAQTSAIALVAAIVLVAVFKIYKSRERLPQIEVLPITLLCLLPYIIFSDDRLEKAAYTAIILLFTVLAAHLLKSVKRLDKKHKLTPVDSLGFYVFFTLTFYGFVNRFSLPYYLPMALMCMLAFTKLCKGYFPLIVAITISSPLFFYTRDASWFFTVFVWYFSAVIFMKKSKIIAALCALCSHLAIVYLLKLYPAMTIQELCLFSISALIFGFLPNKLFTQLYDRFNQDDEDIFVYSYINRTRTLLSTTLYELGGNFTQIQNSFNELKSSSMSLDSLIDKICAETLSGACKECVFFERCRATNSFGDESFKKTVELAISKKKISLIDLPKEFTDSCGYPNTIIFEINRLIGVFSEYIRTAKDKDGQNDLIAVESGAIADILKKQAFELSKSYSSDQKKEALIIKALKKIGIKVYGVLFLGDESDFELNLFLDERQAATPRLKACLEGVVGQSLAVSQKSALSPFIISVTFKKSPKIDACFGIKSVTKSKSAITGDCHSLIKLDENRFLVALSDGMGSGERAQATSRTSLDIIESFYKSGLDEETVLNLVNKVLSFCADDNFSAIDVAIVNLEEESAGFIKVGAPYGFILNNDGVKYIEGSSLPIGILEELQPSTAICPISAEDVILLFSDGVSDAFNSSSEFIDFLRIAPHQNPQALVESVIERAIALSGGVAKDDMTAVAVRLFSKRANVA